MSTNRHLKTIEEVLSGPRGKMFWAAIRGARLEVGDSRSLFARHLDENLTFDIGNNAVLMNLDLKGTILNFISYEATYACDHPLPGVWCQKYYRLTRDLAYKLRIEGLIYDLCMLPGEYGTSLLANVLPITEFFIDRRLDVKLVAFAPIGPDGSRPRAGIYGFYLKNLSEKKISGAVIPPLGDTNVVIQAADGIQLQGEMPYHLSPGEIYWLPLIIAAVPAEDAFRRISSMSSIDWLRSTLDYFCGLTGKLDMPQDNYAGEFLERCLHQCFNATVMAPDGQIAGENSWGSYPPRDEIWMKDFHYTMMPLIMTEPELARCGILWFLKWSVRFKGRFDGGVGHSISNSLAPVSMAGLYYSCTGDKHFFIEHPEVLERCKWLLDEALDLKVGGTNLLGSKFISDGGSVGDFHTGSNIFAWHSLTSFARICQDLGEERVALRYRRAAARLKRDLLRHNTIDGPFGRQFVEGINKGGTLPLTRKLLRGVEGAEMVPFLGHDGEESDTTLASFYGFTNYDDPRLLNHKKLALSEHNVIYSDSLGGILWGDMGAYSTTFPGYISGLAATDAPGVPNREDCLARIRSLTDLDGSIWWWPYAQWETSYRIADQPTRGLGKCGWASGVFWCLFVSQFLGLSYDAPRSTLDFRPFSPSSDFEWKRFRLGDSVFSASLLRNGSQHVLCVTNHNDHPVTVRYRAMLPRDKSPKSARLGEKPCRVPQSGESFLGNEVVVIKARLRADETKALEIAF